MESTTLKLILTPKPHAGSALILLSFVLLFCRTPLAAEEQKAAAHNIELFENKIRPVLVERCFKCHSAESKKVKGGLRLDSRDAALKGGQSGPAVIPGDANASLLIKAIRGDDKELKMPPGKGEDLSREEIQQLTSWVNAGLPFPNKGDTAKTAPVASNLDLEKARQFWSLQPLLKSKTPKVKQSKWVRSEIDNFILAKLEEKKLAPSAPADKRTLLRRASYDLTGLPPTADELDSFEADKSRDAFARAIDRLLDSPHYGEHWGRHWLDVARYGDTRWVGAGEDRRFPFSYTYRDWVISALNRDMSYDRFVTLQLAADQDPAAEPADQAALGFLTVGKWFTGNMHDVIDDQIDVVTRGLLGLTVQCARCHDHKYDPIFTKDYYSLYGLFAACRMPVEGTGMLASIPQIATPPIDAATEKEITVERERLDKFLIDRQTSVRNEFSAREKIAQYLKAAHSVMDKKDKEISDFAKAEGFDNTIFMRWVRLVKRTAKDTQPIFGAWHAFAALPEGEFSAKAAAVVEQEKGKKANKNVVSAILSIPPASLFEVAERYAHMLLKFDKAETFGDGDDEAIRQVLRGNESPVQISLGELGSFFTKEELAQITDMRQSLLRKQCRLPDAADKYVLFRREAVPILEEVRAFIERRRETLAEEFRNPAKITEMLLAAHEGREADELRLKSIANGKKVSERMLQRWVSAMRRAADTNDTIFAAWRAFAKIPEKEFAEKARTLSTELQSDPTCNRLVAQLFSATPPASLKDVATRYAALIAKFSGVASGESNADEVAIRKLSHAPRSLTGIANDETEDFIPLKERDELKGKENRLLRLFNEHLGTPASAMAVRETSRGYAQPVFVRGNPNVLGADAHGGFLSVLCSQGQEPFHPAKGRLELAQAIVAPTNPLAARVIVNRVWQEHFGSGLVRTPSDFGVRGEAPTHPELLDSLARQFIADGWSLKKLHRHIMLSAVYQQSSADNAACRQADPDNRFLWRMNRRRLALEEIRDTLLVAAGDLDTRMGGRPDDLLKAGAQRRTVYGFVDRISLPGFYRYFDFPSSDAHVSERRATTIPQQALFMMNNSFVMDQSSRLAHRPEMEAASSPEQWITSLYRTVYGRKPTSDEFTLGLEFLGSSEQPRESATLGPWRYGYGSYDESEGRITRFEPFPHFANGTWRGGPQDDDPALGRCSLNSQGGQASDARTRSVIRRWVAPLDGKIAITGKLNVQANSLNPSGDGVRGRIVSSRNGQLGGWLVHGTEELTNFSNVEVHCGDTIDFVVEGRGHETTGFSWTQVLRVEGSPDPVATKDAKADPAKPKTLWDSAKDFTGAPASQKTYGIRERYAQVLLESNEFFFLD